MSLEWSRPVWDPDRGLVSDRFDDTYFAGVKGGGVAVAAAHGVAETRHVYVDGNDLRARFAAMAAAGHFTIGEVGFGTGLGLLCAWQALLEHAPAGARLTFVSCEAFPIAVDVLGDVLAPLLDAAPELRPLGEGLLGAYRPWRPGLQVLRLDGGRVRLHLLVGDAAEQLAAYPIAADAWFLDGFSPRSNPGCWRPAVAEATGSRSRPVGATCATFTVAGEVRARLEQVGWGLVKADGIGHKKQVLRGTRGAPQPGSSPGGRAVVHGAGMAGCAVARALAQRDWAVQVIDPNGVAGGASGHDAALYQPRLVRQEDAGSRFHGEAFAYASWLFHQLPGFEDFEPCGVLHPAREPAEERRIREQVEGTPVAPGIVEWLEPTAAEAIAGYPVPHGAAWIPSAGHVSPRALCHALLDHPSIQVLEGPVSDEERIRILAMGSATKGAHGSSLDLPLIPFRGQLLRARTSAGADIGISADGYVGPRRNGIRVIGATYDKDQTGTRPRMEDDAVNWARLNMLPGLRASLGEIEEAGHWVGVRAATPDRLPMVGRAMPAGAAGGAPRPRADTWLTVGHGSRGCTSALLAAEILAAELCAEPPPVDADVLAAIDPARFMRRRMQRAQKSR